MNQSICFLHIYEQTIELYMYIYTYWKHIQNDRLIRLDSLKADRKIAYDALILMIMLPIDALLYWEEHGGIELITEK